MRRDIEIHINTEDITLPASNVPLFKNFRWLADVPSGELVSYLYGEIEVPSYTPEKQLLREGINVNIPYTPIYKPFKLRVKRMYDDGSFEYLMNPRDGSNWFVVKTALYGEENNDLDEIHASELILVDETSYLLYFDNTIEVINEQKTILYTGAIRIFSAYIRDFHIRRVDHQNCNLLLKCIPTNNYRYPLSGVGLIRWTNGDLSQASLAQRIQDEFADDGVIVKAASINNDTGKLSIDANFDNLD